jgi:hypothetical protein
VTDGELPKGPGGGIWDVQVVGPPSNLISCTGARLMEKSRDGAGFAPGTTLAPNRAGGPVHRCLAQGRLENRRLCLLNITGRAPVPASYPMRKAITAVPVEGDVAGGALPMSAGDSFHGAGSSWTPAMVRRCTPIRSADARRACVRAAVAIHRERAAAKRCQGRRRGC